VLLDVPGRQRAVVGQAARGKAAELRTEDARGTRGRPLQPREHPQERRLARAARAEDDQELALLDVERQALQGGRVALRRRVHPEEIAYLDGAHTALRVERATRAAVSAA
jgi:hypothetical protein